MAEIVTTFRGFGRTLFPVRHLRCDGCGKDSINDLSGNCWRKYIYSNSVLVDLCPECIKKKAELEVAQCLK